MVRHPPSVSSQAAHKADMQRAAEWGAERLRRAGLQNVAILPTAGHPVVYGDWLVAGAGKPTVLVYGHYDVQPALDLSLWESPPFEPQQRDEYLYARGASDMKGQTMAIIAAVEAHLQAAGGLPVNVKFLIEGSKKRSARAIYVSSSGSIGTLLACDYSLNNDGGDAVGREQPCDPVRTARYGAGRCRGVRTRPRPPLGRVRRRLHNPAQALCELIAGMHDAHRPHHAAGVLRQGPRGDADERAELARVPRDAQDFLQVTGAPAFCGEPAFTPYERITIRPTLEVLSLHAGLSGEGVLGCRPGTRHSPAVHAAGARSGPAGVLPVAAALPRGAGDDGHPLGGEVRQRAARNARGPPRPWHRRGAAGSAGRVGSAAAVQPQRRRHRGGVHARGRDGALDGPLRLHPSRLWHPRTERAPSSCHVAREGIQAMARFFVEAAARSRWRPAAWVASLPVHRNSRSLCSIAKRFSRNAA